MNKKKTESHKICLTLSSIPDSNGNPRRLFLVLDQYSVLEAIDIGYRDFTIVKNLYPEILRSSLELKIPRGEYNRLLRHYGKYR